MIGLADLPVLSAIARKHGFAPPSTMPVPWTGGTGQVFPCGDVVVKVPFDRPSEVQSVTIDASVAPFARSLAVATPALVAFDDSLELLPVPFAVFERVHCTVTLEIRRSEDLPTRDAWEDVGRQLARVHAVRVADQIPLLLRTFRQSSELDPRPWVRELRRARVVDERDAQWLDALLDALLDAIAPPALADLPVVLCHGDVNAANVLVSVGTGRFRALIDWAGAGWLDPAWDFTGVPLDVVPAMLAGHRSVAPLIEDATAEARILWCQIQTRLYPLRAAPANAAMRETTHHHLDQVRRFARVAGYA